MNALKKLLLATLLCASQAQAGDAYQFTTGWPYPGYMAGSGTYSSGAIDAQNEAVAACGPMPEDATITQVVFINASVNGTAASITDNSYTVSIQGVTTGGVPDGTILGGGTPASVTIPTTGQAGGVTLGTNTAHVVTLANSVALQRGTIYCTVIQHTGATDSTNYINPRYLLLGAGINGIVPYGSLANSSGTWTNALGIGAGIALRSASKTYGFPVISGAATQAIGDTAEKGFSFTWPSAFGTGNNFGVCGLRLQMGTTGMAAAGTYTATLYSAPTSADPPRLQQALQIDSDAVGSTSASRGIEIIFPEDTLASLAPGTKYGIGLSSASATTSSINTLTIADAAARTAFPLGGLTYMSRTLTTYPPSSDDTNAFSETTSTIVSAELIVCTFTVPASGTSIGGVF